MPQLWTAEQDRQLRDAAMEWLAIRTNDGTDPITTEALRDFRFEGQPFPLMDLQRGIRKPAVLQSALAFRTVYRAEGAKRPYEDAVGDDGLIRYKYRGDDPQHPENRALRSAMEQRLPLIWFFGVGPGLYLPTFPVFIVAEDRTRLEFTVDAVSNGSLLPDSPVEERLRRYITVETRRRLHQPIFRATVLRAYDVRCAVCSLRHSQLLDAAHIVPDRHEAGVASVRNGLALCKIHHAAFDSHILGVTPDLVVEIRSDLLDEVDGPMLRYGLQERHGQQLMVIPQSPKERPDPQLLTVAYEQFLSVGAA